LSRQIFAIRPEPGLAATLSAGLDLGLDIIGDPMFEIEPLAWTAPDPAFVDAVLIGSANAVRHGGPQLDLLRGKPFYAVGNTTAEIASSAGFDVERIGEGGLQSLLNPQKDAGAATLNYLRLSGAERVELVVPRGISIEERIVYRSAPISISDELENRLQFGGIVLLHSAAAARHFADECDRLNLPRKAFSLAALGPRITTEIGSDWAEIRHADRPDDAALLALAKHMCQDH
jgi:uroporphyrinogen-III synthase